MSAFIRAITHEQITLRDIELGSFLAHSLILILERAYMFLQMKDQRQVSKSNLSRNNNNNNNRISIAPYGRNFRDVCSSL